MGNPLLIKDDQDRVICKVVNLSKIYPGVIALDSVDLELLKGEVHGLIGKNGAGKSTLVNILAGFTLGSSGEIWIKGKKMLPNYSPYVAEKLSIYLVPQNPLTLPQRSLTENMFIGYTLRKRSGLIDEKKMRDTTIEIIKRFKLNLNPDQEMQTIPLDAQKLLLFGKGIYIANANIFMLDEITASLNVEERKVLSDMIRELINEEKTILFISHHLKEIMQYCNRITVLRDGKKIITENISNVSEEKLSELIVGKDVEEYSQAIEEDKQNNGIRKVLSVKNLCISGACDSINFDLHKNEVLGFAGLDNCGKEELFRALFGAKKFESGIIEIEGKQIKPKSPEHAIKEGVVYLPKNREEEAIMHGLSIEDNMMKIIYKKYAYRFGLIKIKTVKSEIDKYVKLFNIKFGKLDDDIDSLSGGNKQKVVLSRITCLKPKVFVLNEPTQGVDVGVKQEILKIIREDLATQASIILSSESIQELIKVCDRIVVLYRGAINKIFGKNEFHEEQIYKAIQGI